uniref:Uncharacterized protein n=1 Tax=Onchocerca volvulus TaxID=6282 RepID=A0A8R1TTE8_ONCVO
MQACFSVTGLVKLRKKIYAIICPVTCPVLVLIGFIFLRFKKLLNEVSGHNYWQHNQESSKKKFKWCRQCLSNQLTYHLEKHPTQKCFQIREISKKGVHRLLPSLERVREFISIDLLEEAQNPCVK